MSLIEELLELLKEVDENPFMGKYTSLWIELKKIVQKSMSTADHAQLTENLVDSQSDSGHQFQREGEVKRCLRQN